MVDLEASNALAECRARIRQLEEENSHLRQAAKTFGDLAERLKHALDLELGRVTRVPGRAGETAQDADPNAPVAVGNPQAVRLAK